MLHQFLKNVKKAYRYYNLAAGALLLMILMFLGAVYVKGTIRFEKLGPAFKYITSDKDNIVRVKKVKVPEGPWITEKRKSLQEVRKGLKKEKERLEKRQTTIDSKIAELNQREEQLDQREEKIDKEKELIEKNKKKWREEITDRNLKRITQTVQSRAGERGNPQEALQMLHRYITVNKKDGQPNYQLAYRVLNNLPQENRTTLLYILNQSNLQRFREEMLKRFGPLEENQQPE